MKKILFVINTLGNGGAQRVVQLLADCLNSVEHNVKVLCVSIMEKEYDHSSFDIIYINTTGMSLSKWQRIKALRKYFKGNEPDIVISFEYFLNMDTIVAARGLGIKVIVSERNDPAQQRERKVVNFLRDYLYRKADVLVCQTPDAKAYFSKKVQEHSVIIPNPVKSGLPSWCGQNSNKIINFCRLEKQKNLPLLIDAFEQLHKEYDDFELLIYGDGREGDALKSFITERGIEQFVHIYPAVNDIHRIASACRMFVSSSDYEGLSNSMLEAMAMGMPTVCTDCPCGGARMVIENNVNGILVPVGDRDALVAAMRKVIADVGFAAEIAAAAQNISEKLSQTKIAEKWIEIIR